MNKKWIKRLLSLTVALEMICSPLTTARADEVAHERLEIPQGEEVLVQAPVSVDPEYPPPAEPRPEPVTVLEPEDPAEPQAPDAGGEEAPDSAPEDVSDPASAPEDASDPDSAVPDADGDEPAVSVRPAGRPADGIGTQAAATGAVSGLLAVTPRDYVADIGFGLPMDSTMTYPVCYDGYFKWEWDSNADWGYRTHSTGMPKYFNVENNNYYTNLPHVGRMPDLQLEGFYVLGEKLNSAWYTSSGGDPATLSSWSYDERWTGAVKLDDQTTDDVEFSETDDYDYDDNAGLAMLTGEQMAALWASGVIQGDATIGHVPIVARWQPSDKNQITFLSASTSNGSTSAALSEFFTENPSGKTDPASLTLSTIDADSFAGKTTNEFWIRVAEDQESLSLKFEAYEPYYTYNIEKNGEGKSPVSVSVVFNGEYVTRANGGEITATRGWEFDSNGEPRDPVYPAATVDNAGYYRANNSTDAPARSRWMVEDIPLAKVADAEDSSNTYTTVTIYIDAPNGARTRYIFHVERLMTPTYELGLGNTPMAMIEKDVKGNWGNTPAMIRSNKDTAKARFAQYYRLGMTGVVAPGDYTYYKDKYDNAAWYNLSWEGEDDYNIDLDETAVIAYQDAAFVDPGVSFVGSDGQKVLFGSGATGDYKTCVQRTIQLKMADKLTVDLYGGGGETCWYNIDNSGNGILTQDAAESSQILQNADGSDKVDLRGLRVLPGVYTIVYTFTDPLDPSSPIVAKRPLVVLPIPGDVDMDGAVTIADALTAKAHAADWENNTAADIQLLFYRVLSDGVKDADKILNGFQPVLAALGQTDYYYPPLPVPEGGGSLYDRKTWSQVESMPGNGSATLELRFLGVEPGVLQGEPGSAYGHTNPAAFGIGPWEAERVNSATPTPVSLRETDSEGAFKYNIEGQNDVFWVGVYLTPGDLAGRVVEDLTLTLIYDSDLVRPAVVYTSEQFTEKSELKDKWYSALFYYNMGTGSKYGSDPKTLFSGKTGSDYTYESGTSWDRSYATHYSKVIGELETIQNNASLREMVISFQSKDASSNLVTLPGTETCVLVMPFQLIKHPTGSRLQEDNGEKSARLVELGAGMRDFNLVTKAAGRSAQGINTAGLMGQLFAAIDTPQTLSLTPDDVTYAYSAQETIYGGVTQNLRQEVSYASAAGMIPIGENKTSATILPRGEYAKAYNNYRIDGGGTMTDGFLPKGMTYTIEATQGVIRGTPEETGEFKFTITKGGSESYYILYVDKRQLHFRPVGCGVHYGQEQYRNGYDADNNYFDNRNQFRFTYTVDDLADRDKPAGVTLTGEGTELETILKHGSVGDADYDGDYTTPTFTAMTSRDSTAVPVTLTTGVGTYPIMVDQDTALDDKYELVLDTRDLDDQVLQIFRRPVWIDHITADAAVTGVQIYSDGENNLTKDITLSEPEDEDVKYIHLSIAPATAAGGYVDGRPLSGDARVPGDKLWLHFSGKYQRNAADITAHPNDNNAFYMDAELVTRDIGEVFINGKLQEEFNKNNPNYTLMIPSGNDSVLSPAKNEIKGLVRRREVTGLALTQYPAPMRAGGSVEYGTNVSLHDLRVKIDRAGQQIGDFTYDYNGDMAKAMNIHYNWVTAEEMAKGLTAGGKPDNTLNGSGCTLNTTTGELVDTMSYKDTNDYLTVAMDGMYLCAIARKFEISDPNAAGDNDYIKCYSANPIRVTPKTLTLTVANMSRYYAEKSAEAKYTYNPNELTAGDIRQLRALYNDPAYPLTGDSSELIKLFQGDDPAHPTDPNFVAPTIQSIKNIPARGGLTLPVPDGDANLVTTDADATDTTYYQVIFGAQASNYTFRYARVDTADRRPSTDFGSAYLTIMKRPIVVEDVVSMFSGTALDDDPQTTFGDKETFGILYADSKNLLLAEQVDGDTKTKFTAAADPNSTQKGRVTFTAPNYDPETLTVSYYSANNSELSKQTNMVYSGDPVRPEDLADLGVTYKVQFLPDQGHYSWSTMSQNYYDVDSLDQTGGRGQRPVELRELKLTGEKADNYMLVYNESFHAMQQAPANAEWVTAPKPTTSADVGNAAFLQYGTGLVILRPIESMQFKYLGNMDYTYGERFSPKASQGSNGRPFTVTVNYATRYDNYPSQYQGDVIHNVQKEDVTYAKDGAGSTFAARGFLIHYIDVETQEEHEIAPERQILSDGDPLYPDFHDGKHLFISGKRGDNDPLIYSSVTDSVLKVRPAELTLTARDVHRYYGEENKNGYVIPAVYDTGEAKPMSFTFPADQLARWDREKLGELLGKTISATDTVPQAQLEEALAAAAASADPEDRAWAEGFGYQAPTISSAATKKSPINTNHGKWGEYDVEITTKHFTNYTVSGVGGTLYVYPRPIQITKLASSQADPAYIVYDQTGGTVFNTSYSSQDRVTVVCSSAITGTDTWPRVLADGLNSGMLHLSGDAMVGTDQLIFRASVQYLDGTTLPDGITDDYKKVVVTIEQNGLGSSPGEAERNYVLSATFADPNAVGAIKLRTIGQILIESPPTSTYTYGDTLNLSGLKVRVIYMMLGDESQVAERETITYESPEQFQGKGLYVNYWDTRYDTVPSESGWKGLPTAYRKAATGDHLTIAPTHDTQRFLSSSGSQDMSNPLARPFAANGTGLIVSAYLEGDRQTAAQPKIVAVRSTPIAGTGMNSFEVTPDNNYPLKFAVAPLRLNYEIQATDKTYNGDVKTAGTVTLKNVFDRTNVQITHTTNSTGKTQVPVKENITDVIYIPVGAGYELPSSDADDNYAMKYTSFGADTGYRVSGGAISFTTGSYTNTSTGYMDKNSAVVWAQGYAWNKGLLEFTFPNANVHYEDDAFASGRPGVGTADLAQYWRTSQDFNTVDGRWDTFPAVSQMPVEVRNMNFIGPDAANYTWGASDAARKDKTELTLDSNPANVGPNQGNLPYATIQKANRQPIQDLLRDKDFVLPTLQVDEHTNVVRMTYGEDLGKIIDLTDPTSKSVYEHEDGTVLNETGVEDYHDELHFEYALAYQDENGLLTQWAGREGTRGYQDTLFFGGEVFLPTVDEKYLPEAEDVIKEEEADEDTPMKGNRYRWAKEDTGVSERGYTEDGGFWLDVSAYPGYKALGGDDTARKVYWFYDLYDTDRAGLPRDTVFYPLVRLAETHNYNPSGDLTGDADGDGQPDISAKDLYDARVAAEAYHKDRTEALLADAQAKAEVVFTAGDKMEKAARDLAKEKKDVDTAEAESGDWPETLPEDPGPISAIKTYSQRFDVLSANWTESADGSGAEYLVTFLEDLRFTDILQYPELNYMDSVLDNFNPKRYYAYFWDPDRTAPIAFGEEDMPIDFDTVMTYNVVERLPSGDEREDIRSYDPEATNHTAKIYARLTKDDGRIVRSIRIVPNMIFARVGDKPVQLGVVTDPLRPRNDQYIWRTSDPTVATVNQKGLLTIQGEGMTAVTVRSTNGKTDYGTVVVSSLVPADPLTGSTTRIFNLHYTGPWAELDSDYAFRPKEKMTRGDVVRVLDLFLTSEASRTPNREMAYVDVTGKERYYGALVRLHNVRVVQGVPGSIFAGDRLATRAEFITMLVRMLQLEVKDTAGMTHAFVDAGEDSTWAYAYIDAAAKAGIIRGTGNGYFAPSREITREEAAAIIARLVVSPSEGAPGYKLIPSDMTPENWSYPAVLRAVNTIVTGM